MCPPGSSEPVSDTPIESSEQEHDGPLFPPGHPFVTILSTVVVTSTLQPPHYLDNQVFRTVHATTTTTVTVPSVSTVYAAVRGTASTYFTTTVTSLHHPVTITVPGAAGGVVTSFIPGGAKTYTTYTSITFNSQPTTSYHTLYYTTGTTTVYATR